MSYIRMALLAAAAVTIAATASLTTIAPAFFNFLIIESLIAVFFCQQNFAKTFSPTLAGFIVVGIFSCFTAGLDHLIARIVLSSLGPSLRPVPTILDSFAVKRAPDIKGSGKNNRQSRNKDSIILHVKFLKLCSSISVNMFILP